MRMLKVRSTEYPRANTSVPPRKAGQWAVLLISTIRGSDLFLTATQPEAWVSAWRPGHSIAPSIGNSPGGSWRIN